MNIVFFLIVAAAFATAAWRELAAAPGTPSAMEALSTAMVESAAGAVELALGLGNAATPFGIRAMQERYPSTFAAVVLSWSQSLQGRGVHLGSARSDRTASHPRGS
jgi:hypothetical protein